MEPNWKSLLVKNRVGDFLLDELPPGLDDEAVETLRITMCESKADIPKLEAAATRIRKRLDPERWEQLKGEIAEIKEDNRWLVTKRGKYTLAVNEWIAPFHGEFSSMDRLRGILIGGHQTKEAIFLCG